MRRHTESTLQARIDKARRDCPTPIMDPRECIEKALQDFGDGVCVSWSGGRCSTVVLHMALALKKDIRVVFNNTGVEFPETYQFIRELKKKWSLNFHETKPKTSFWACVKMYGFPMLRGKYHKTSKSKDGKPKCCTLLKERPMTKYCHKNSIQACLTGIRVCESRMRMFGIGQFGQYYYAKKYRVWRYHPIAFWSDAELLKYIDENNIPVNGVYEKGQERCGCWPCTGYVTWREALSKSHPRMYQFLNRQYQESIGEPTLWEYQEQNCLDFLDSEGLIE